MTPDIHTNELRDRRSELLRRKEWVRLREAFGEHLAKALSLAVGHTLALQDFRMGALHPFAVSWSKRIETSPGLSATYVSKTDANKIASCVELRLPRMRGMIGVFGNEYLGLCDVPCVSVCGLVEAAEKANDAVVFYPSGGGVVLVDCYTSNPGNPFSVLVQGDFLVEKLRSCFESGAET